MLLALTLAACPTASDDEDKDTDEEDALAWYTTCGDPACHDSGWTDKDLPACETEAVGEACTAEGEQCDPHDPCNATLLCTTEDPATECPISLRAAKRDIRYLDAGALDALHDRLVRTRLASWR